MKKRIFGRKLSRSRTARKALLRNLAKALFLHGKIKTTMAKAKTLSGFLEKELKIAKNQTLAARRRVLAGLANDRETTERIFKLIQNSKRVSGFTRIIPLPARVGDRAKMARIELVDWKMPEEKKEKTKKSLRDQSGSKGSKVTGRKINIS